MSHRVFISHAFADHERAGRIARALKAHGVETHDPIAEIASGENWDERVIEAIKSVDAFIFLVPEREGVGQNALFELGAARAMGKRIIPVVTEPFRFANSEIASALARAYPLDASSMTDDAVARSIGAAVGKPR